MGFILAIDGPAGAGKSTTAREVATQLGFSYLDTGAMYRSIAHSALLSHISSDEEDRLVALAHSLEIAFSPLLADGTQQVIANGIDISHEIRTPEVSEVTSKIASIPRLREIVVESQQLLGRKGEPGVVLEGRDIGTVVFPNAELKIFLTATASERLRRRIEELQGRGLIPNPEDILREIVERDERDTNRRHSPLRRAEDAVEIVTDGKTRTEVVGEILSLVRNRRG